MFIFLLIYITSFIVALREVYKGNTGGIFIFLIFGLSIYTTAMSVAFMLGLKDFIPLMQVFKEALVFSVLILNLVNLKHRPKFHLIDYLIFAFLLYLIIYAILPIGEQSFVGRLMALKSISFYIVVYFTGRFFDPKTIYINKYFSYIILLTIAAAAVLLVEVVAQSPLQFHSGYFDYSYYFFNLDSSGDYGLQVTFTSDSGYIRFGSFFTNPLEHAAATLIALAVIFGLYTRDDNKFTINGIGLLALSASVLSILFALSRAPLASYCIMIYVYALVTKKKFIVNTIQTAFGLAAIYIIYLFYQFENNHSGIMAVVLNTIDFSDPSSIGHLLAWVEGIVSISQHPFGLGLGSSGRVGASLNQNIGGENQFIIIGVQAGIIALVLYLIVFVMFIKTSFKWLPLLKGKERKLCLTVFLIKIGLLISTLSSEIESSSYVSYMNWFLSGLLISMIMHQAPQLQPANDN
ncbi:hypothetical protein [Mucilaginibacter sp.]|uniref:O-antigen ligase family protein n=1 Tax=Mucilaginibacter sp. TaxID=1882438 RepID=UPI002606BC42|nr:hypothetical protein [Mucilaginibacter sp.]MDB4926277.1 hypothetical protein [Mucilaginibacter sp.]